MSAHSGNLDGVVRHLYSAAAGRAPWKQALDELALTIDARAVHMMGMDRQRRGILFSHCGGSAMPEAHLDYVRTWHRSDPGIELLESAQARTWVHCHEHFDEERVATDPFWQEFLIPFGGRYRSSTKILDDEDLTVILAVHSHEQPLGANLLDGLESVRGHLGEAMVIYRHLRALQIERAAGAQLMQEIGYPIVLVDAMRGILFRNRAAAEALEQSEFIVERGGLLGCTHPRDDAELTIAVQALDLPAEPARHNARGRRFLRLQRASGGQPVGVYVSALIPQAVAGALGQGPAALLIFHDPDRHGRLDPYVVAEMFGLTPAEARVAVRLARGQGIADIAADTGRSPETVRTQIKSILAKAGLERRSELVRVLASLQPLHPPQG